MTGPYINKGRDVYIDPTIPGDGGAIMDPAMVVPPECGLHINEAPVTEQTHEYVLSKKPRSNAKD